MCNVKLFFKISSILNKTKQPYCRFSIITYKLKPFRPSPSMATGGTGRGKCYITTKKGLIYFKTSFCCVLKSRRAPYPVRAIRQHARGCSSPPPRGGSSGFARARPVRYAHGYPGAFCA